MSSPKPDGRLRGEDLVITRTFRAPIDDVWTSITSSESSARWFGPWEKGADDKHVRIQMAFEEGKPWMEGTIERCDAPNALTIQTKMSHFSLLLTEASGVTTLEFVHHKVDPKMIGSMGPGWEYYLDNLVAAREGRELPKFDSYFPSQKEYYASLK